MTMTIDLEYAELLARVQPKAIETEAENEYYLAEAEKLMKVGEELSPAQTRLLKLLATLIEDFEQRHYQLKAATPLEILTELMTDRGLKQKDVVAVFGSQGIASEVLSGKREISKVQAKALGNFFKVSPLIFFDLGDR